MPRGRPKKKEEAVDPGIAFGSFLRGDRYDDDERYKQSVDSIYKKLKPIWLSECKDAVWLLQEDYSSVTAYEWRS